jgi:serine/threonine protein kinase
MLRTVTWRINSAFGETLGAGKFGVVYQCKDSEGEEDDWPCALKRLQKDVLPSNEACARFKRETDLQSDLAHENVVPVVDAGESEKYGPWFVMPRAMNGSLKDAIADGRAADPAWALQVFEGVLEGMAHAHEQGVMHRDIKPSNVLMFGDVPRIADFGIARQVDNDGTTLTHTAEQLGTFRYMAPEQLADVKRVNPAADVYSLGKVLCHLLSGIVPEPFKVSLHGVPSEYRHFIDKCCRDEPSQRFQTAREALARFRRMSAPIEVILPTLDQGRELAESAEAALRTDTELVTVDALETHFQSHSDDREVHMEVLPRLSAAVTASWLARNLEGFRGVIVTYDTMLTEANLNFAYCDVVARFYREIFRTTDDVGLKRLVLTRLVVMGHEYNRFFVHDLVVEMLSTLDDACDIEIAEEVVQENTGAASWYTATALKSNLPAPVAAALRSAKAEADDR